MSVTIESPPLDTSDYSLSAETIRELRSLIGLCHPLAASGEISAEKRVVDCTDRDDRLEDWILQLGPIDLMEIENAVNYFNGPLTPLISRRVPEA
jgi:hypothetical protein